MDSQNERADKIERTVVHVAKMNAEAVVQTIKDMHVQMAEFKDRLDQQAQVIAMLQSRFDIEQMLKAHLGQNGSGPTA
jgi:phage protein D